MNTSNTSPKILDRTANTPAAKPVVPTAPAGKLGDAGPSWYELAQSRRERRGRTGLAVRLICYFLLTVLTAIGGTAIVVVQRNSAATTGAIDGVVRVSAQGISVAARDAVATRDVDWLKTLATDTIKNGSPRDPARIERLTILDASGATLASAGAPTGMILPDTTEITVPIGSDARTGSAIGSVRLAVSTALLDRSRRITFEAFAGLTIAVGAAAMLIVIVYVRQAHRPLRELTTAMRRVVAGDLDAVIPIRGSNKHVFRLAEAFQELVAFARREREATAAQSAAMAASIAELEGKLASNTAQLEAANGRLQSEIAEKEDFLRAVSHDLNAPLRNIGGMVAMLMMKDKDKLAPDVLNRLERIKKNVDVETDLINELLELSRIKTRRQCLEIVDTESIVWDLRGMFDNDLKTRHIELTLETSLPQLYAERARVRQVLLNLIDNAIKYMGDDNPRRQIRIGCTVSVTEAVFYVTDTGMGIDPEDIDKVFCIFRRGRGEVAQKVPGKGVGLASVKSIVETYSGRIWVTSTLGEGTTFHFAINGKYVPIVSTQLPTEMRDATADTTMTTDAPIPALAA